MTHLAIDLDLRLLHTAVRCTHISVVVDRCRFEGVVECSVAVVSALSNWPKSLSLDSLEAIPISWSCQICTQRKYNQDFTEISVRIRRVCLLKQKSIHES